MHDEELTYATIASDASALDQLGSIAESIGAADIASQALDLRARVDEGRFYVACVGEFKRGKSTLVNALVGAPVLPTGIVPVTAVPTVLRYGERAVARIRTRRTGWCEIPLEQLVQYVSEEYNPENTRGVEAAEVFVTSPLLRGGMSLVDTPGIGSVFEGNTATTEAFVPHIDAAIAVLGVDPPISGDELTLIKRVAAQVPHVLLALNKADRHSNAERAEAVAFAERVLGGALAGFNGDRTSRSTHVLQVSALQASRGAIREYDWEELVHSLGVLQQRSASVLVRSALTRGVSRLAGILQREVDESVDALARPIAESELRVATLRRVSEDASRRVSELRHLFDAEEERLARTFDDHRAQFRERVAGDARTRLENAIDVAQQSGVGRSGFRGAAIAAAAHIAREVLKPWLSEEARIAEELYRATAERLASLANDFLEELARAGELRESHALLDDVRIDEGFRVRSRFYFSEMMAVAAPVAPGTWFVDVISPKPALRRRVNQAAQAYLKRLLASNTAGVTEDLRDRVRQSRRGLEVEVRRLLRRTSEVAERALERARAAHSAGSAAVDSELVRLEEIRARIGAIHDGVGVNRRTRA